MSTIPQTPAGTPPAAPAQTTAAPPQEVTVVSHSNLFYWWPVWAVGFLMAIFTAFDKHAMAIVPPGTKAWTKVTIEEQGVPKTREGYVLPEGKHVPHENPDDLNSPVVDPYLHMASKKGVGVIFSTVLLLVIVITNVPLRGMWSLVVILTIVLLSVILALAGAWEYIFSKLTLLDIRINMGGYLLISGVLFAIWLGTFLFFDKQTYIVFTPRSFRVCTEIGGGEKVYDTMGMTLERQKGDLFRHYLIGLGSGDMIVKTAGAQAHHFDLPNVLAISRKMKQIDDLLRSEKHVSGS